MAGPKRAAILGGKKRRVEAAIIPEAKVSGYRGITRISTSTVEVRVKVY
jgi:hypothetical protein